jgi:hypothetical protein
MCAAALVALSACASSGGQPAGGHPSTVSLRQADQGRRITVTTSSTVIVRLDNTYWQFHAPAASGVLRFLGVSVHRGSGGVPGSGTGTVVARYRAVGTGQAVVSASRRVCGEAMACSPSQRSYRVKVVVHG